MDSKRLIKLYDVRCTLNPPAWSPNVWKVRFVLNFKRLPYKTEWVGYPDIATTLSSAGVPPTRTEAPLYTVPAIVDKAESRSPVALADSSAIMLYLEKTYPKPSIFPAGAIDVQMMYESVIHQHVYMAMRYMVVPNTTRILEGGDLEYYLASRESFVGVALEDMFPPERQDSMWHDLFRALDELSSFIDSINSNSKGSWPFSHNDSPSYADFVLGAILVWFKLAGPEGGWDRIKDCNGGKWERHLRNLKPYSQVL